MDNIFIFIWFFQTSTFKLNKINIVLSKLDSRGRSTSRNTNNPAEVNNDM